jgi:Na+/melibiose symporter-like transporter
MNRRRTVTLYFGLLIFFSGVGDPTGLVNLPVLLILKDRLHASAEASSLFEALSLIPSYAAILFGVLRDRWNPFGLRDRAYFAIAAPLALACYLQLAFAPIGYARLLIGIVAAMAAYQMIYCSWTALLTVVGQREKATGKLSALRETIETVVRISSVLAGGWIAGHWEPKAIFLLAAALTMPVLVQSFWSPKAVFPNNAAAPPERELENLRQFFQRIAPQGRKLWPVAAVLILYNFSPGWYTPLLYYLTDVLHLASDAFGLCRGVQQAGVLAATLIYSRLCGRFPLRNLLWYSISVNVAVGFLYLAIGGFKGALAVSAAIGFVSGFATVAVFDLLMRSCPAGLEGSALAAGHSVFGIAGSLGDLLGATIYSHGGFALCIAIDAAATALILPLLTRLPREILLSTDQQTPAAA